MLPPGKWKVSGAQNYLFKSQQVHLLLWDPKVQYTFLTSLASHFPYPSSQSLKYLYVSNLLQSWNSHHINPYIKISRVGTVKSKRRYMPVHEDLCSESKDTCHYRPHLVISSWFCSLNSVEKQHLSVGHFWWLVLGERTYSNKIHLTWSWHGY